MLSQTESEFIAFDAQCSWNGVYQKLKNEASLVTRDEDFSTKHAKEPDNRHKNRYRDVSPFDHSRVKLSGDSDYINASLIEVPEANRKYILTQGPLEHTMGDFWQMTWEQGTRAIVMLNRVIEKGSLKCSQYWPLGSDYGSDEEMYFEECGLRVTLVGEEDFKDFTLRTLQLENMETGDKREVLHFHYTTWPDFGVPTSPNAFLYFLHIVQQTGSLEADVGPAIVHCSAGIGRSGTFCLVDSCLVMVKNSGTLNCIDVRKSLIQMRSFRMGLIQTADQLRFSYLAIIEGAHAILNKGGLGSFQSHPEGQPPQPPERTTSLQPPKPALPLLSNGTNEEPPAIPPKKSPRSLQPSFTGWESKLGDISGKEDERRQHYLDDNNEEFDTPLPSKDKEDSFDGRCSGDDVSEDIRMADLRHQIREERKKQTMEKIRQMKEKQRKSERWRAYRPFIHHSIYFGLALLVGAASFIAYKYFW